MLIYQRVDIYLKRKRLQKDIEQVKSKSSVYIYLHIVSRIYFLDMHYLKVAIT